MAEFLHQFPAAWMAMGAVIAGLIFYVANHKVFALQAAAQERLSALYKETIATLETERNDYKTRLHKERDRHQATLLENETLKAKTDLSPVMNVLSQFAEDQRGFIKEQTAINGKVLTALTILTRGIQHKENANV